MEWYANPNLAQINVVSSSSYMVVTSMDRGDRFSIGIEGRWGYYIVPLNDSTFVSAQNLFDAGISETHLYFIDRRGDLIHTIVIERDIEFVNYEYETSEYYWVPPYERCWLVSEYSGDAIFHDIFNDTLYRIKSRSEITPHLVFKRGDLSPRPEDKQRPENKQKQAYFTHVMESGDHIFLSYTIGDKTWRDVWSKRTGNLLLHTVPAGPSYPFDFFVPYALPDGSLIDLQVVYADKDNIYCVMEALDACKFLPDVKEDDNPVIVIAKLKK